MTAGWKVPSPFPSRSAHLSKTVRPSRQVTYEEVRLAVLVQIRYEHSIRKLPAGIVGDCRLERSIAIAQQHADRAIAYGIRTIDGASAIIHYQDVLLTVLVHIRDSHRLGEISACEVGHCRLEGSVAISPKEHPTEPPSQNWSVQVQLLTSSQ